MLKVFRGTGALVLVNKQVCQVQSCVEVILVDRQTLLIVLHRFLVLFFLLEAHADVVVHVLLGRPLRLILCLNTEDFFKTFDCV